jgi:hypothetical protein
MIRKFFTILSYLLGAIIIVVGTIVLVAYGKGYVYDLKSHRLVHEGLVILQSTPSGARVTLDGRDIRKKTPYRQTFAAGQYDFSVTKDGFRPWRKIVNVIASEVSLAQYIILFPQHIPVSVLHEYSGVSLVVPAVDDRRVAFAVMAGSDAGLWALDTGNDSATKVYVPAAASDVDPAETITGIQWSKDDSHMLIQSSVGDNARYHIVAADGSGQPIDVGSDFGGQTLSQVRINPLNWREVYAVTADGLRRLDVGTRNVTPVLVSHLAAYDFATDRVIYVDTSQSSPSLWALDRAGHKLDLSASLPVSSSYLGTGELAVLPLDTGNVTVITDPFSANATTQTVMIGAKHIAFNDDGHYVLAYAETTMQSYDVEKHQGWHFEDLGQPVRNVSWLDTYHVLYDRDGHTVVSEFDGGNTTIMTKSSAVPATVSGDSKTILVFQPTSSGTVQLKALEIRQ